MASANLRPSPSMTLDNVAASSEAEADGTYDAGTADLINELQAQLNALLAELKAKGYMAAD